MERDDLRAALGDLTSRVPPLHEDAATAVRERGRQRRRRRNGVVTGLTSLVLVAVVLTGIAFTGRRQSPDRLKSIAPPRPPWAATSSTVPPACTTADLKHLGLAAMPQPERVKEVELSDMAELEPPDPNARPLVSAATVWAKAKVPLTRGASYSLLLAVYSGPYPSPTPDLLVSQQLAWVAVSDHIPVDMRGVSYPHLPGESSPVTRPPCHFGKRFDVFDARTGKHLTSSVTGE